MLDFSLDQLLIPEVLGLFPKNRASETWVLHNACVLGEAFSVVGCDPLKSN